MYKPIGNTTPEFHILCFRQSPPPLPEFLERRAAELRAAEAARSLHHTLTQELLIILQQFNLRLFGC